MAHKRYNQQGAGALFGEYLYERAVPDGHFLRQLEMMVDWDVLSGKLVRLYRGKAQMVRLPCNPSVILKMLLLA